METETNIEMGVQVPVIETVIETVVETDVETAVPPKEKHNPDQDQIIEMSSPEHAQVDTIFNNCIHLFLRTYLIVSWFKINIQYLYHSVCILSSGGATG